MVSRYRLGFGGFGGVGEGCGGLGVGGLGFGVGGGGGEEFF